MRTLLMIGLLVLSGTAVSGGELVITHESGEVLFEDALNGSPSPGWRVPPENFVEHPEYGTVYLLEPGDKRLTVENPPWVGDTSWECYRLEFEVCTTGGGDGWVGPDFHVQEDGACSNLQFYSTRESNDVLFESSARWVEGQLAWKLFPFAQRIVKLPKGEWAKIRVDVGDTFANVYMNGDTESCYTVRYLPFSRGGIRLWNYAGSGYFRNLRVTALSDDEIEPKLEDPWTKVIGEGVIRDWEMTPLFPEGATRDDALSAIAEGTADWMDAPVDVRGVVAVSAAGITGSDRKGVIFARTIVSGAPSSCRLTYTDQITMWVNGVEVFKGEPRGWFDPGRSPEDWFGRLIPDQFEVELSLSEGENEILVRLEVNEPLFGSGFWMRTE